LLLINARAEIEITIIMIEDPNNVNGFMCAKYFITSRFESVLQRFYRSFTSFLLRKFFPVVDAGYL
jgi:hypothetical protein